MFGGNSGGFGSTNTTFGSPSNNTFGFGGNKPNSSPFGGSTGGFGTSNTTSSPFGASKMNTGFGTTANTGFGSTGNTFGGFGSTNTANTGGFGFNNTSNTATTGFNTSTMNTNTNLPGNGTGNINYQQTKSGIEEKLSYNYISMTAMPQFQGTNVKTIEELRLLDYGVGGNTTGNLTTTSNSLFGNTNTANTGFGSSNTGGLFGNTATTNTFGSNTTSGGLFGQNTSTFGNTGGFGTTNTTNTNTFGSTNTSGSLFGSKPTTGTNLFGGTTNTSTGFGATSTGFNTNTGGGLFGSSTQNTSGSMFGNTSTGFGATTTNTSGGLFGNTTTNTGGGLFGSTSNQNQSMFGSSNTNTSGGLFGANKTQSGSLFGNTGNTSGGGLFGNTNTSNSGGLFGNTTNTSSGGLFGNTNTSSNLFGNTNTNNNNLFGGNTSTSLFGNTGNKSTTNLFGNNNNNNTLFGSSNQNNNNANADIMKLINLAGFAKNSNIEMKRHLELAKRAWNPSTLSSSTEYGPKKFKFQVATEDPESNVADPLEIKKKFDLLKPDKHKKPQVQSIGALVVRSAQKNQRNMQRIRHQAVDKKLQLMSNPNLLKLTNKFKIDKSKRKDILLIKSKPILSDNEAKEQEDEAELPQKLLFAVKSSDTVTKEINPNAPTLSKVLKDEGYRTRPDIEVLKRMSDEELSKVKDFAIIRVKYGAVMFPGEIDVRNIALTEDMIEIGDDSVEVYKSEEQTPPVGQGLNRRAEITIQNVAIPLGFAGGVEEFEDFLKNVYTPKIGAKFLSYHLDQTGSEEQVGTWRFQVDHFTKYGFDEKDFDTAAKKQKVSKSLPISFLTRLDRTVTSGFWKTEGSARLALESLALFRKFRDDTMEGVSLAGILALLKEQRLLAEKTNCDRFTALFELLEACFLQPFQLLKHSTGEEPTLEMLLTVLKTEHIETLPRWYTKWKNTIKSKSVHALFEAYKEETCLVDVMKQLSLDVDTSNVFIAIFQLLCETRNASTKAISKLWQENSASDILLYQVSSWLVELGLFPEVFESQKPIVTSLIAHFIATRHTLSLELQHNVFLASLDLVNSIKVERSQFEVLLKSFLFSVPTLASSKEVMLQIEVVAENVDATSEFETIKRLLNRKQTFLKFNSKVELELLLLSVLERKEFEDFQVLMLKALRVGVFDKRQEIPLAITSVLEKGYDQGFKFKNVSSEELIKIQEMYLHVRNLLSFIFGKVKNADSEKISITTYQQLYVLMNQLYTDIEEYKKESEGIGLTYITHIEQECDKVYPQFQYIFQGLDNLYHDPKLDFIEEVRKLHREALKEIFS